MDEWLRQHQRILLEHPLRAEIMGLLLRSGGLGRRELQRRLTGEPPRSEVVVHLARLEAAELVCREGSVYRAA